MEPETDHYWIFNQQSWDESGSPALDDRLDALQVLDRALEVTNRMRESWISLKLNMLRIPIAVNCGTAGSGKTTQLYLAMRHFEKKWHGKALYITFNGASQNEANTRSQECSQLFVVMV